ncbi:MAG: hybrid sensor histidine kinase/response regulator [Candidatus Promineifilaceae bacterium]
MEQITESVPTILIVDDEINARRTLEMLLLLEGYNLLFAEGGLHALAMLEEIEPDTILLDVMMPGMDGFEVCRRIKSSEHWQHIPIILTTALDSKADLTRGLKAGADDFVSKPVNGLELRARVRSMLRIKRRHDALQQTLQLRSDLANMIMHDIRNPLTSIAVYCDLLEREIHSVTGLEYLETVRQETSQLSSFVTDMLLTAKMEQHRLVLDCSSVDLNELLRSIYQHHKPLAELRGIDLELMLPSETRQMSLDAELWKRVIDNLLSNAFKFSPGGSKVTLKALYGNKTADDKQPDLRVEIADEGPGIPKDFQEIIFNRYDLAAKGRRNVAQVGLGLAFCKLVVDAHDGRIWVENNEPHGAVFVVELYIHA